MKKDIRFRIWIPEAKQAYSKDGMYYQRDQYLTSFLKRVLHQFEVTHEKYLPFDLEERLMRSIGMEDNNGKEIFEGDLCKWGGDQYVIQFQNGTFLARNIKKHWIKIFGQTIKGRGFEIIGNIYQSKEEE